MKTKTRKKRPLGLRILFIALAVIAAIAVCYLLYLLITYYRIDDRQELVPQGKASAEKVYVDTPYRIVTQNAGFGAFTPDFTFFMDGGKSSCAASKESVLSCINAAADTIQSLDPDFVLMQEVDKDSTRSHHVDERALLIDRFAPCKSVFACNMHTAFIFYPFYEPHGASNSGLLTLSNAEIVSSLRRQLPISEGLSKLMDIDRCYSVSRIPVENGKELLLYNVHLSAYGGSDEIRTAQMTMLFNDMKAEYEAGNYCICGGDFNHDFTGNSTQLLNGVENTDFGWAQPFPEKLLPKGISRCLNYTDEDIKPSCRNNDIPYKEGNFTIIVDGFLVSDNVESLGVTNYQTGFAYSDHNPVVLDFLLK